MGFHSGAYATVWDVQTISDTLTKIRISISRKNKQTEKFEEEFSGFVACLGTSAAKKAACLNERDRIKLGSVDATTFYSKEKDRTYHNYNVFSFDVIEKQNKETTDMTDPQPEVDDGDVEDRLPF